MEKITLNNGLKIIYEHRAADITSFCIGFNAGALEEEGFPLGTAHAVEHMVYKGTVNRNESEINKLCDSIFGFQNAMTNFPYVIYYGTCLSEDFKEGFELYSDIVLNPIFPEEGFKEEISIILEELKEWKDDLYQYCEDSILYNAFERKRIKNLIIGTEESIKVINLNHIKDFYSKYYTPENCVISICSSLSIDEIKAKAEQYFGVWQKKNFSLKKALKENNKEGSFEEILRDIKGAKIQYLFSIDLLNDREMKAFQLFNEAFGEGTSGILFDTIRTKNGLAYDVKSVIKNERGMKFFTIIAGTSPEKSIKTIELINGCIDKMKKSKNYFNEVTIKQLSKSISLKRQLKLEKSIQLCKELSTYELMYNSSEKVYDEVKNLDEIKEEEIIEVINKVLNNPTIQVITRG